MKSCTQKIQPSSAGAFQLNYLITPWMFTFCSGGCALVEFLNSLMLTLMNVICLLNLHRIARSSHRRFDTMIRFILERFSEQEVLEIVLSHLRKFKIAAVCCTIFILATQVGGFQCSSSTTIPPQPGGSMMFDVCCAFACFRVLRLQFPYLHHRGTLKMI